eukprot:CAMPEP_0115279024 /NCGR_PEP_ID=MMETSP0270-20121206/58050_1 /TAXON_ID=71861 /ORGANISM="Scrippsiella trochoidea, Strain CCMP3099" /LENGTH=130 /DNA_ID=CAMNT_0002695699 /DNA_START=257 /DNA_END=649 /DNA_ORIENTATION=-
MSLKAHQVHRKIRDVGGGTSGRQRNSAGAVEGIRCPCSSGRRNPMRARDAASHSPDAISTLETHTCATSAEQKTCWANVSSNACASTCNACIRCTVCAGSYSYQPLWLPQQPRHMQLMHKGKQHAKDRTA